MRYPDRREGNEGRCGAVRGAVAGGCGAVLDYDRLSVRKDSIGAERVRSGHLVERPAIERSEMDRLAVLFCRSCGGGAL